MPHRPPHDSGEGHAERWPCAESLLNNIPDIAWLKDCEGRYTAVNEPLARAAGRPRRELLGLTDFDVFPPEVAARYRADDDEVRRTRCSKRTEERLVLPDGTEVWLEVIKTPILDEGGAVIGTTGVARDLSFRRRADAALRDLDAIVRRSPAVVFRWKAAPGWPVEFVSGNVRQFGYTPEQFLSGGLNFDRVVHPEDVGRVMAEADRLSSEGREEFVQEYRVVTAAGDVRWVEDRTWIQREDGRLCHYEGVLLDVTERKRAREALRESRQMLLDVLAHFPGVVFWKDRDLVYQGCNRAFAAAAGLADPADIVGKTDFDLPWAATEASAYRADDLRVMDCGAPTLHIVESQLQAHGRVAWFDTSKVPLFDGAGAVRGVLGVSQDITERRQVGEALRVSEERYALAQRAAKVGSWDWDLATGTLHWSDRIEPLFGFERGTFGGTYEAFLACVHADDRAALAAAVDAALAGMVDYDTRHRIVRPDGTVRWMAETGDVVRDCAGRPVRMLGIVQDITERVRAEEERVELERRLLHSQKLESLGVLAGGVAHDFNNLLHAVLGNLDLALLDVPQDGRARASLERAGQAGRRAADLTRQLLAYSGQGRFVLAQVDLNELLRENAGLFRTTISRKATVEVRETPGLPSFEADPSQLQQVVMNLITNASEALEDRPGTITLATGIMDCDGACLAASRCEVRPAPGRFLYMEVSDTGCGMDATTQARLFEPFFSTKFVGRGLGMSAVLGIVRGHRGAVLVDSSVGRGTTVRVLFPFPAAVPEVAVAAPATVVARAAGDAARAAPPAAAESRGPCRGTILVVDDEPCILEISSALLPALGFRVLTAANGLAACEVLRDHPGEIACIILDLTMPVMDGVTALPELRKLRPGVRILLASGYSEREATQRFTGGGLAGFVQKPFRLGELRDKLEAALKEG